MLTKHLGAWASSIATAFDATLVMILTGFVVVLVHVLWFGGAFLPPYGRRVKRSPEASSI